MCNENFVTYFTFCYVLLRVVTFRIENKKKVTKNEMWSMFHKSIISKNKHLIRSGSRLKKQNKIILLLKSMCTTLTY